MRLFPNGPRFFNEPAPGGDDGLLPPARPVPQPRPAPAAGDDDRPREVVCGFCESRNTLRGELIKLSPTAHGFRDSELTIKEANRTIAALKEKIADLESKIQAAQPSAKKSFSDGLI